MLVGNLPRGDFGLYFNNFRQGVNFVYWVLVKRGLFQVVIGGIFCLPHGFGAFIVLFEEV